MGSRWLLSLMTVFALLLGGVHSAAMAGAKADAPVVAAAVDAPCHMADADAHSEKAAAKKAPAGPDCCADCCPGGCDGACTPVAAFFALPQAGVSGFARAVVEPLVMARAPSGSGVANERPPKTLA